ncbi:TonB-dependent receptor plug domain-containing protein [Cytophagales bacterium LB-30]|uniref:TonB-dependent receptor plug domain-containing protein n=1 Tax=Shiella aurantiaca TaxID=3058365 RepID=A0ABT8F6J2_9BACT|nr:TonB-dependent receptor plug domain-containing protein [Shiella aurantiaca]MDN4166092.1 TonB-dependent receptor plug domain-containing protein [Shiella aurantiaca]
MKTKPILLILLLSVFARVVHAQEAHTGEEIRFNTLQPTLKEVLNAIEAKTDFSFSYNPDILPLEKKVILSDESLKVSEILKLISDNFNLSYTTKGNIIFLKKRLDKEGGRVFIHGYLRDGQSGENLIGGTVYCPTSSTGALSNYYGHYTLQVKAGEQVQLIYSYVGYQSQMVAFDAIGDTLLNISLYPQQLDEVTVTASKLESIQEKVQMSAIDVPMELIRSMPVLLGETDILKALQLLPGVKSGTEGTSGMYVRGGSPDQNLILLDGVPVYNASHLFGFFSVFNDDAVNHVELLKGGFPARYGGRLSSVLNVNMKEGNNQRFQGGGAIGLISSKLYVEGPIAKGKGSYMVSGRRTYADVVSRPFMKRSLGEDKLGYYFYDFNAKANYHLSPKDRVYVSVYLGNDEFYSKQNSSVVINNSTYNNTFDYGFKWGNKTAVLRWNHLFSPSLFANTSITYSNYDFSLVNKSKSHRETSDGNAKELYGLNRYQSGIEDYAAKIDFEYNPSNTHSIKFGTNITQHLFSPGATSIQSNQEIDTTFGESTTKAIEAQLYVEDEFELGSRLKSNIGLHSSYFLVNGRQYPSLQPRFSSRYLINSSVSLKASYATMVQYIHLLTNSGIGLPTDLWVPSTKNIEPQQSWQAAFGAAFELNKDYEFSVESYYKEMDGVIEYKEGANFLEPTENWEAKVEAGWGDSYGVEFFLQKKEGRLNGWLGYTLAYANRRFNSINSGKPYPFRYDVRHDISFVGNYKVNSRFEVSSAFVYKTGIAVTLPIARYETDGVSIDYYGGRNAYRMPNYHRMDFNAIWKKEKKWGERAWVVSVYNIYNNRNPFFIEKEYSEEEGRSYKKVTIFTFLPSVSYQFSF